MRRSNRADLEAVGYVAGGTLDLLDRAMPDVALLEERAREAEAAALTVRWSRREKPWLVTSSNPPIQAEAEAPSDLLTPCAIALLFAAMTTCPFD